MTSTVWTIGLAQRSPGQEILLQVIGTWWCIITWFSYPFGGSRRGGEMPHSHLPLSQDSAAAFQFPAFTEDVNWGISCRANLISLFTEPRWQRWPTSAHPLENPWQLGGRFLSPGSHFHPRAVTKMILGHETFRVKIVYGACWDASKETFSGTNKMFLLGKGLHWSSKLSLKWNTDQSTVTHTWHKGDAPLEEPLLLCTWMGDSFILEPWLTVQEICIRKGDSWFFRPKAQERVLPTRPSKPHLGTCWKGGNSGFNCHLHRQSTKVPDTNFSGFPCLSPHATQHPNEKFN